MNYKQNKTIINKLINIKFKICALLGRSDCGGEISKKPSLWGIEISPNWHWLGSAETSSVRGWPLMAALNGKFITPPILVYS